METRTEKLIKRSGGKSKASLSKVKTSSEFLRSPVNYWEYCSITMTRYRSGISDGNRNALLVITILVITATYTIEPPKWEKEKEKDSVNVYVLFSEAWRVLWGFNTLAFFSALFFNFVLLPLGKEYTLFYLFISIPLICSYGISMFMHDKATVFEPKVSSKIYSGGSDNCNREGEI